MARAQNQVRRERQYASTLASNPDGAPQAPQRLPRVAPARRQAHRLDDAQRARGKDKAPGARHEVLLHGAHPRPRGQDRAREVPPEGVRAVWPRTLAKAAIAHDKLVAEDFQKTLGKKGSAVAPAVVKVGEVVKVIGFDASKGLRWRKPQTL